MGQTASWGSRAALGAMFLPLLAVLGVLGAAGAARTAAAASKEEQRDEALRWMRETGKGSKAALAMFLPLLAVVVERGARELVALVALPLSSCSSFVFCPCWWAVRLCGLVWRIAARLLRAQDPLTR